MEGICIKGGCYMKYFPFCLPLRTGSSLDHSDSSAFLPGEIFLTRRYTDRTPIGLHVSEREEPFPPSRRPAVCVSRSEDEEESAWCVCSCGSSGYLMQPRTKQPPAMFQPVFSLVAVERLLSPLKRQLHMGYFKIKAERLHTFNELYRK